MAPQQDEGDWGETDLDPREQEEALRNLEDPSAGADEPWSPPGRLTRERLRHPPRRCNSCTPLSNFCNLNES